MSRWVRVESDRVQVRTTVVARLFGRRGLRRRGIVRTGRAGRAQMRVGVRRAHVPVQFRVRGEQSRRRLPMRGRIRGQHERSERLSPDPEGWLRPGRRMFTDRSLSGRSQDRIEIVPAGLRSHGVRSARRLRGEQSRGPMPVSARYVYGRPVRRGRLPRGVVRVQRRLSADASVRQTVAFVHEPVRQRRVRNERRVPGRRTQTAVPVSARLQTQSRPRNILRSRGGVRRVVVPSHGRMRVEPGVGLRVQVPAGPYRRRVHGRVPERRPVPEREHRLSAVERLPGG